MLDILHCSYSEGRYSLFVFAVQMVDILKNWNRDLLAVCNFRRVWDAYMNGRKRPDDLKGQRRNGDGDEVVGGAANAGL